MSGKTNLTQKELDQLKVIADFLFFDEYQNKASYPQFEKTFGMFFKEAEIYLENVFKELCGPKKKYLTFPRLIRAYLDYKNNKSKLSSDTRKFFAMLFNRILKTEDDIILKGKKTKYKFYTSAGHKKRSYISKITVITDPNDMIEGMKIQYDDHMDVPLYDESQDVFFDSELEIGVIKTEDQEGEDLTSQANNITEYVVRDSITHIFGTYTDKIELLGFKTRAGKTYFAGKPIGEGFIYGNPMRQFHYVKFKVGEKNDGMYNLQPYFTSTPRTNEFLKLGLNDIKPALWENEELINEEKQIEKLTDEDLIDKYVLSAPIVSDDSGAGQEVKEANTTNDMEDLLAKDQKLYTMKDKDTTQEEEEASQLTLNDLISGGGQQVLRSRKPGQKSAPKAKATEEEGEKKTKKKIKAKQLGKERQVEENIFKDKKSYTQLVNRLSKDIEADLEKEKDKLRAAKETKNKAALEKKEAKEEKKKNKSQSKPKTQSKAKEEKPKEESKKKKKTKKKVASQGLGEEGPVLSQNYFRSKPKKETKPSTSSKKKPKIKTMASKKNIEKNTFDTPEEFFDSVANSKSTNDIDDILNMDNDELKKMFYSKVVPTEEKPKKVKSKKNKSKTTDDLKKEEKKEKPIESKKSKSLSKTKGKGDPKADKRAQTNWKKFVEDMENKKGLKILQNIGAVINAIGILSQEEKTKEKLPLAEKIRLLELLEENQNVIDFLYKGKKDTASKKKAEEVVIEDEDADITGLTDLNKLSIDEIAARINRMDELIREAKTEKEAKKLNKIKDKYVKRKNKILKEEEEKAKNEMVKKEKIKDTEIKKGEEEKRKKAVEEKNDYLNTILKETEKKNILIENAEKMAEKDAQEEEEKKIASLRANKGYASKKEKVSQTDKKKYVSAKTDPKHSFRNQKMPKTKDPFEDTIFEPIEDNLCESEGDEWLLPPGGIPEDVEGWEDYTWARIEEVFRHKNYKIFDIDEDGGGQIEDDDIIQGQIGDCYFLSAVASLSNRPDYIDKLFYVKEKSANNAYGIYYCINGEWKLVVLDDYFPVIPGRLMKKLAFSCNNGNEFWVCLLEKAWAKINGNYARIGCGGLPHEVFDVLTEAWSEGLSIKKPKMSGGKSAQDDPLWQKLLRCQEKNFILTAGTGATGEAEEMGLCSGHAYSILGLYEVGKGSSRVRLVKLRNPWGYGEWVGDYSDDSVMWTAAIKKVVKPEDCQDDGEFYMTYEDFCHYYASMGICHFGMNYYYATKKVSSLKSGTKPGDDDTAGGRIMDRESGIEGPAITKVDVSANNTNCYFRICQKNPRFITPTGDHYPSCVLQYIMLLDKDYNYLAAECNSNPTTCIRYPNLKAGTYYLITDTHYRKSGRECGYVISAYSDKQVGFSNVSKKTVNINEIINRAAGQLAEKIYNGEETEGEIDKTLDEPPEYDEKSPEDFEGAVTAYVTSASNKRVPFIVAHFVNHTNNKATVDLNIKKTTKKVHEIYCNDEIGEDENNFTLEIPPKGENTVLINKMAAANKPALSYEVNYSLDEDEEEEYEYEEEEEEEEEEDEEALEKVFQEKADPIDKAKKLYQYYMETDKGYVFGIENNSTTNRTISMDLTGLKVCSGDYKGRTKFNFALPAKSRRSFDTTAMSWNDELSFFFKVIK